MRKIILILLTLSGICKAQQSYDHIEPIIKDRVEYLAADNIDNNQVKKIVHAFQDAGIPSKEDYTKKTVGIVFSLYAGETITSIYPAVLMYNNAMVSISGLRTKAGAPVNPDLETYVNAYRYRPLDVGKTDVFDRLLSSNLEAKGEIEITNKELVVIDDLAISFIRSNDNWTFVVSIDKWHERMLDPNVLIYCFRKDFYDESIFSVDNNETVKEHIDVQETSPEIRLYHNRRLDLIREPLNLLITEEPFKSDKKLIAYVKNLTEELNEDNIGDYLVELDYILYHTIFLKEMEDQYGLSGMLYVEDMYNINHLIAHSLGDYYLSQKDYAKAFIYLLALEDAYPYHSNSGTTINNDRQELNLSLGEIYLNFYHEEYAYIAHLMAVIIDGQTNVDYTDKQLLEYMKIHKSEELKEEIDRTLENLEVYENTVIITFPGFSKTFVGLSYSSKERIINNIRGSWFYHELQSY